MNGNQTIGLKNVKSDEHLGLSTTHRSAFLSREVHVWEDVDPPRTSGERWAS